MGSDCFIHAFVTFDDGTSVPTSVVGPITGECVGDEPVVVEGWPADSF